MGVVPGVRRALFDREPNPTIYLPFGGNYRPHMIAHLRTAGSDEAALAVLATAGREIRAIDPRLPILSMKTLDAPPRAGARALDGSRPARACSRRSAASR